MYGWKFRLKGEHGPGSIGSLRFASGGVSGLVGEAMRMLSWLGHEIAQLARPDDAMRMHG